MEVVLELEAPVGVETAAAAVRERLVGFVGEVTRWLPLARQRENAGLYVRGLIEDGRRKSLQPTLFRLGEDGPVTSRCSSFSPTRRGIRCCLCGRVRSGSRPRSVSRRGCLMTRGSRRTGGVRRGVKRQYSGTLGKIGNCQIGVSVHAVGSRGTVPLGWALYLPEDWCADSERRARAKIPEQIAFKTKPELGVGLVEHAAGWGIPAAPVLGDQAYGDNTPLRERLHLAGRDYVLAVAAPTKVFAPETLFVVPEPTGARGRPKSRALPDSEPVTIGELVARVGQDNAQTVTFRDGPEGEPISSRFVFVPSSAVDGHAVASKSG